MKKTVKIGVLSDTHIPYAANDLPKNVYAGLEGAAMILHAGDLVELGVLDNLKKVAKTVAVIGNMDSPATRKALNQKEIVKVKGFKIGIVHGEGPPDGLMDFVKGYFADEEVDVIIFGHSHSPVNETKDGILFFNPGSPTDKIFAEFNSYGILEIDDKVKGRIIKL